MSFKYIVQILLGKRPLTDVWHYMIGNYRYYLFYSKNFKKLIRKHIFEQIKYRIEWMDRECYYTGSCRMCGCETTALQMANKPCKKPCYPAMMKKRSWIRYRVGGSFTDKNGTWKANLNNNNKPILIHI